jgi:hypothetical protein
LALAAVCLAGVVAVLVRPVVLSAQTAAATSELRDMVALYSTDRAALGRRWDVEYSPTRRARFDAFYRDWQTQVAALPYDELSIEGKIDHVLVNNELRYQLELLRREERLAAEMDPLIPFARTIRALDEARREFAPINQAAVASILAALPRAIAEARKGVEVLLDGRDGRDGRDGNDGSESGPSKIVALRAANALEGLRRRLERWYEHYAGYDPVFKWWNEVPYGQATDSLQRFQRFLEEKVVGFTEGEDPPIVGDPIGADGMAADLVYEMIPYSPQELIAIAEREFAWCEARMLEASRELGFAEDWKAALEHVKTLHVEPGEQPELVRMLAREAIDFLIERNLVTIPPLAEEVWRLEMMSPEMQKVAPFFLGGEVIRVSFPTDEMEHDDKLMSMRGNNVHFSRATVHHELIPGHHLQGFMTSRYNRHRGVFSTPFWGEGWALYWEMLLWDLGFPQTPEDRVGMLFWRMHRAARIIFSLSFHLERMTPQEAIDFLVDRVGHERANATAEVRRSFNGNYSPLYQAAYMLGGLQIRALHEQLVGSGTMTNRQFHDAILQGGRMPIEMVRARLLNEAPPRDFKSTWRFYGDPLER